MTKTNDPITTENRESDSFSTFVEQFIATLLWSSGDEYDEKSSEDLSPEALQSIEVDCQDFLELVENEFLNCETAAIPGDRSRWGDWEQLAHDYCLTRNEHGAGFSSGHWDDTGIAGFLYDKARIQGEMHPYADDDGYIEIHKG